MAIAETISIGTELLLGDVLDTNCQYLAIELAKIGINVFFRATVGDNKDRIKDTLRLALNRSDIIITTGGLGPTPDDLTTECIAEFFSAEMISDAAVVARIEEFFKLRNVPMPESNKKQALLPKGASWLPNPAGTAPGIIWNVSTELLRAAGIDNPERNRVILTFPGVPSELHSMWETTAKGYLEQKYVQGTLWSCELKHYGIGESALAEQYNHLLHTQNPTVAPYAGKGECRLRVTAKAATTDEAKAIAQPVIDEIKKGSGTRFYGIDKETLESVIGKMLLEREFTLSVAESCTGGLVSKRLTDIAGSSSYIKMNVVTYANDAKENLLKVPAQVLTTVGAVSAECARSMAQGVRKLGNADLGLSITGIAGPGGGTEDKPVGLVYFGLSAESFVTSHSVRFSSKLSRDEIRFRAANEALNMVRLYLLQPESYQNYIERDELKLHYFMTITRGIAPQFKGCELDTGKMPHPEAKRLKELIAACGIQNTEQAFVERAGSLVTWRLQIDDQNGTHVLASKQGDAEGTKEFDAALEELLNFLNPYLEERLP